MAVEDQVIYMARYSYLVSQLGTRLSITVQFITTAEYGWFQQDHLVLDVGGFLVPLHVISVSGRPGYQGYYNVILLGDLEDYYYITGQGVDETICTTVIPGIASLYDSFCGKPNGLLDGLDLDLGVTSWSPFAAGGLTLLNNKIYTQNTGSVGIGNSTSAFSDGTAKLRFSGQGLFALTLRSSQDGETGVIFSIESNPSGAFVGVYQGDSTGLLFVPGFISTSSPHLGIASWDVNASHLLTLSLSGNNIVASLDGVVMGRGLIKNSVLVSSTDLALTVYGPYAYPITITEIEFDSAVPSGINTSTPILASLLGTGQDIFAAPTTYGQTWSDGTSSFTLETDGAKSVGSGNVRAVISGNISGNFGMVADVSGDYSDSANLDVPYLEFFFLSSLDHFRVGFRQGQLNIERFVSSPTSPITGYTVVATQAMAATDGTSYNLSVQRIGNVLHAILGGVGEVFYTMNSNDIALFGEVSVYSLLRFVTGTPVNRATNRISNLIIVPL